MTVLFFRMSRQKKRRRIVLSDDELEIDEFLPRSVPFAESVGGAYTSYPRKNVQKYILHKKLSIRNDDCATVSLSNMTLPGTVYGFKWQITFMYNANMTSRNSEGHLDYDDFDRTVQWMIWVNDGSVSAAKREVLAEGPVEYPQRVLFSGIEILERIYLHDDEYDVPAVTGDVDISSTTASQLIEGLLEVPPTAGSWQGVVNAHIDAHQATFGQGPIKITKKAVAFNRAVKGTAIWKTLKVKGKSQIQRKLVPGSVFEFSVGAVNNIKLDLDAWIEIQVFFKQ